MIREILIVSILFCGISGEFKDPLSCEELSPNDWSTTLSINSRKTKIGDWMTSFKAWKDSETTSKEFNVQVHQKVKHCGKKEIVHIQGVINGPNDELTFHPNCGTNIAISNDGRTISKIRREEEINGVVLTNRPLKTNELFEVVLQEKGNLFSSSFGIGITTYSPNNFEIPDHMWNLKSGNWILYDIQVWKDGKRILGNYGPNLNDLKAGDRVGVVRNSFGTLHFFVNGVDQGAAAANIPFPVYGVYELKANAMKASIVDVSNSK